MNEVERAIVAILFSVAFGEALWLIYANLKLKRVGKKLCQLLDTQIEKIIALASH